MSKEIPDAKQTPKWESIAVNSEAYKERALGYIESGKSNLEKGDCAKAIKALEEALDLIKISVEKGVREEDVKTAIKILAEQDVES